MRISQKLKALMAGVMYNRPPDAVSYLRDSLEKVLDMPNKDDLEGCASIDA